MVRKNEVVLSDREHRLLKETSAELHGPNVPFGYTIAMLCERALEETDE